MAGFEDYDWEGTLTIAGFSMNRPAWMIVGDETGEGGLVDLITGGERRGENRVLPMQAGVVGYPHRLTDSRYDLRLAVNGDVNSSVVETSNSQQTLNTNLALIRSTLFESASPAADGTLAATLVIPGWGTKTAGIQMIGLQRQRYNASDEEAIWVGTLQIQIPDGRFA